MNEADRKWAFERACKFTQYPDQVIKVAEMIAAFLGDPADRRSAEAAAPVQPKALPKPVPPESKPKPKTKSPSLTTLPRAAGGRMQEVATLYREGLANKEIAARLSISDGSVSVYLSNARKNGLLPAVGSAEDLAIKARRGGANEAASEPPARSRTPRASPFEAPADDDDPLDVTSDLMGDPAPGRHGGPP